MTSSRPKTRWIQIKGVCPACGHEGYCTRSENGEVIKCMRAISDRPIRQIDGITAWIHAAANCGGNLAPAKAGKESKPLSASELKSLAKQHRTAVDPKRLKALAETLGMKDAAWQSKDGYDKHAGVMALKKYGIGWDADMRRWSFPMYDHDQKIIGFRLRGDDGRKLCVPGSRNGLFVPDNYEARKLAEGICDDDCPLLILMPEGPTDAATAAFLGYMSIGRPSSNGGIDMTRRFLERGDKQEVVVVADNDETKFTPDGRPFWPGVEGAVTLCEAILPVCGVLKFLLPPTGIKDLRDWAHVKDHGIFEAIDIAPKVTPRWLVGAKSRLEKKREQHWKKAG